MICGLESVLAVLVGLGGPDVSMIYDLYSDQDLNSLTIKMVVSCQVQGWHTLMHILHLP